MSPTNTPTEVPMNQPTAGFTSDPTAGLTVNLTVSPTIYPVQFLVSPTFLTIKNKSKISERAKMNGYSKAN